MKLRDSGFHIPECMKFFWSIKSEQRLPIRPFLTKLMFFPPFFYPPSLLIDFISSQFQTTSSSLPSTTMCFHHWPFIETCLFGNPSGVIWSVNREGVSLCLRLVCLGVSLTIMVSCSLEAHVPPSALVSSSHLPYVSPPLVAGVTDKYVKLNLH